MNRSDKQGFRRFLPLIFLAAVLILAAAFVWILPSFLEKHPAETAKPVLNEPTYRTIEELDPVSLKTITVTQRDADTYTLVNQDGKLYLRSDGGTLEPINEETSADMIKYATTIYVEDTITDDVSTVADQLPSMELEPPNITVTATYSDSSDVTIQLGTTMLGTSYHYYRWSGDSAVYLCHSGVYDTFDTPTDMLRTFTQLAIVPSLVDHVSIQHGDGIPIVCALETNAEGAISGMLQSPYAYPMSAQTAKTLLHAVSAIRLGARLEPLSEITRAEYGLLNPQTLLTISQRGGNYTTTGNNGALQRLTLEPSTITLSIGDVDGEFYRYVEYEGTVYRVASLLIDAFLDAAPDNYTTKNPADMGGAAIQTITVQTGTGVLQFQASYLETVLPNNELLTDEAGNIVYTTNATCNGDPISADAFDALVSRLWQLSVTGTLPQVTAPTETPLWRMSIETVQGRKRTLAAYPMDALSDVLTVDGVALHYINKEALEIALGEFSALLVPAETPAPL